MPTTTVPVLTGTQVADQWDTLVANLDAAITYARAVLACGHATSVPLQVGERVSCYGKHSTGKSANTWVAEVK